MKRKRSNQAADGFVGILAADIHFPENGSLKDKRQHLRSLKAGISRKLGASIAEVGFHDLWQRTRVLVTVSCSSAAEAERAMDMALRWLEVRDHPVSGIFRDVVKVEGE